MTTSIALRCLHCPSHQIVKCGKTDCGVQRYRCQHQRYAAGSFLLDSLPAVACAIYTAADALTRRRHQTVPLGATLRLWRSAL